MSQHYDSITINTDGGSRGNPGPAGIGAIAKSEGKILFTVSQKIGVNTNNVAEYMAVIVALDDFNKLDLSTTTLNFVLDSELVVKQIEGLYKIKQHHLQELQKQIAQKIGGLKLTSKIQNISFTHVLRHLNKEADLLVNQALDS